MQQSFTFLSEANPLSFRPRSLVVVGVYAFMGVYDLGQDSPAASIV